MTSSEFINSFQQAWGLEEAPAPDTTQIRGLFQALDLWIHDQQSQPGLDRAVMSMANQLQAAARAGREEMSANPDRAPEIRQHNQSMNEGFSAIAGMLIQVYDALVAGQVEGVSRQLVAMTATADQVTAARLAVESILHSGEPRCPRCGSTEGGANLTCSGCGLDLLTPDPSSLYDQSLKQAKLGAEYGRAYQAYLGVSSGRHGLTELVNALKPLESKLNEWRNLCLQSQGKNEELDEVTERMMIHLEEAMNGVRQMAATNQSRQMSDLNQGWNLIFENAVDMQRTLPALGQAAGLELPEAEEQGPHDSITING